MGRKISCKWLWARLGTSSALGRLEPSVTSSLVIKPENAGVRYQLCQYNQLQNLGIGQV